MLDDLKMIHARDKEDALGVAQKQWRQLKHRYDSDISTIDFKRVSNIVVGGMGGSALAGSVFAVCPGAKVPFEVVRDYDLPKYAGSGTLFVASSYSGNTEETLSALEQAKKAQCQIAVIASSGQLMATAKDKNYVLFELPSGLQPRMAAFYTYAALSQLLSGSGLLSDETSQLDEVADWLGKEAAELIPTVPTVQNQAKKLALEIVGSSIAVYSGPKLYPAAYKWKISFNENAKTVAWSNQFPEFSHNELPGWTSQPTNKPYKIIELRSSLEHPRTQKRFEVTERLLSGQRPSPHVVVPKGDTLLKQMLWTIQLGDFTSIYLALLNGLNPSPVDLIEKFKKELNG